MSAVIDADSGLPEERFDPLARDLHRYDERGGVLTGLHMVHGGAGVGKSTLAHRVARRHVELGVPVWLHASKTVDAVDWAGLPVQARWNDPAAALQAMFAKLRIEAGPLLLVVDEAQPALYEGDPGHWVRYAATWGRSQLVAVLMVTQRETDVPSETRLLAATVTTPTSRSDRKDRP